MIHITKTQATYYLINHANFDSGRTMHEVITDLSCLQVDPINVVARSHELILHNRIKYFNKQELYTELYEKRNLFEYWMQLYSIIPISSYPYIHWNNINKKNLSNWKKEYIKKHKKELELLLNFIRENGPTYAKQIKHLPKGSAVHSWKGESSQTALLEFLWNTGELQISYRENNFKFYDLSERVIGDRFKDINYDSKNIYKHLLDSFFKYYGILRTNALGRAGRDKADGLRKEFQTQLKAGEIIQIQIHDSKVKYFIQKSEFEELVSAKDVENSKLKILSPLDPLVLDRQLLLDTFGFFYRWEAYTPPAKRQFGFYNMPILFEDRFIGQIDLAKNNNMKNLEMKGLFLNEKSKGINSLIEEEIGKLESFAYS